MERFTKFSPTIIGLGFEAGSGKDTVADYLAKAYGNCGVLRTSFAKALRYEVHQACREIMAHFMCPGREAMEMLCYQQNVPYDPFPEISEQDPLGKQRILLQRWGMEMRSPNPNYWVDKVAEEIAAVKPNIVLISDVRFRSEANWIKSQGGFTIHIDRPDNKTLQGAAASHVSEQELAHYAFDHKIVNDSTLPVLHKRAADLALELLQRKLF